MPSKVFDELLLERIEIFRSSFIRASRTVFYDEDIGKIRHTGEFGTYREAICREFLRFLIPGRLALSSGFLINSNNKVSSQCDVVVYDANVTPLIQSEERQRFFPVETVCAVGEVKSAISSRAELEKILKKLSNTKRLRESVSGWSISGRQGPQQYYNAGNPFISSLAS